MTTLRVAISHYFKHAAPINLKPTSVKVAKSNLKQWSQKLGHRKLDDITSADVIKFRNRYYQDPNTANRMVSQLSSVYRHAITYGMAQANPCELVQRRRSASTQRAGICLDHVELAKLETEIQNCRKSISVFFAIAVATGARLGEIEKLEPQDVDFDRWTLTFRDTKTHDNRTVPISPEVGELIRTHGLPGKFKRYQWKKALEAAGIKCRFHDLRHTYITTKLAKGAAIPLVQKMVGHKSILTTMRYTHISVDHLRELQNF